MKWGDKNRQKLFQITINFIKCRHSYFETLVLVCLPNIRFHKLMWGCLKKFWGHFCISDAFDWRIDKVDFNHTLIDIKRKRQSFTPYFLFTKVWLKLKFIKSNLIPKFVFYQCTLRFKVHRCALLSKFYLIFNSVNFWKFEMQIKKS